MRKKRSISFTVNDDIENYLNNLSEKLGMNRSAVITMIINQYRQGNEALNTLKQSMQLIEEEKNKK
jgi:predicted DNA-binding protein